MFIILPSTEASINFPSIGKITNYDRTAHFHPNHRTFLTTYNRTISISNAQTGAIISNIPTNLYEVAALFSQDGSKIFVAGHDYNYNPSMDIYDTVTNQLIRKAFTITTSRSYGVTQFLMNKQESISYMLFNRELFFIDIHTGTMIDKVTYERAPKTLAYNPQRDELVVAFDQQLLILDANNAAYKQAIPLVGHTISSATFDQLGQTLYVTSLNQNLLAFDATKSYTALSFTNQFQQSASRYTQQVRISPNNNYLLLAGDVNGQTSIYERATGKHVAILNIYSRQLAFSQDTAKLIIGTNLYDATTLQEKEFVRLDIADKPLVHLNQLIPLNVYATTTAGEKITIPMSDITWAISNEAILKPSFGQFSTEAVGTTTVTATYKGLTATSTITVLAPFADIPTQHPHYTAIHAMRETGIINGYNEDNTYRPNNPIPRHHIAAMIGRSTINLPAVRSAKSFTDVPSTHQNFAHIQKLYQAGIIDGDGAYFNPSKNVTHIQLAKMLTNIFQLEKKPGTVYSIYDVDRAHWGYEYAQIMIAHGIMPLNNRQFNPNTPVTRSQFAQYLYNAFEKTNNSAQ